MFALQQALDLHKEQHLLTEDDAYLIDKHYLPMTPRHLPEGFWTTVKNNWAKCLAHYPEPEGGANPEPEGGA